MVAFRWKWRRRQSLDEMSGACWRRHVYSLLEYHMPYNVNPLVRKHLHLRNAFVTSVLNIQLSCLAITFIVLVMQATQTPLELAMAAYEAQQHIPEEDRSSLRTVATDYGVLPGTLSKRLRGLTTSRSQAYNHLQALSNDEEASLIDYIRRSSLLGHPPPPYMVYETADAIRRNRVLIQTSPTSLPLPPLGHTWLDKFRKRHPEVTSVWTRQLDTSRLDAAVPENLAPWFAEVGTILDRNRYQPENIFNMDETGYGIGTTQSTRCLVIRDREEGTGKGKKATKATSGRQEWVTTIECVSAAGHALPQLVIFKATGSFNIRWLPDGVLGVQGWRWTHPIPVGRTTSLHTNGSSTYSSHVRLSAILHDVFLLSTATAVMSKPNSSLSASRTPLTSWCFLPIPLTSLNRSTSAYSVL